MTKRWLVMRAASRLVWLVRLLNLDVTLALGRIRGHGMCLDLDNQILHRRLLRWEQGQGVVW
jgi:hypothetical protein